MKLNDLIIKVSVLSKVYALDKTTKNIANCLSTAGMVGGILLTGDASAASLLTTAQSIFTTIYAVVATFGAIGVVVTGLNWAFGNFIGSGDPKKLFFQVLLGVAVALGAVAIIQTIKTWVAGAGDDITTL